MVKALAPRTQSGFAGRDGGGSFLPSSSLTLSHSSRGFLTGPPRACSGRPVASSQHRSFAMVRQDLMMDWVEWDRINSVFLEGSFSNTHSFPGTESRSATLVVCLELVVCQPLFRPRLAPFVCIHPRCRGDATGALPGFTPPIKSASPPRRSHQFRQVQPSLTRACSAIFPMACATKVLPPTLPMASLWNAFGETALSTGSPSSKHFCSSTSPCSRGTSSSF